MEDDVFPDPEQVLEEFHQLWLDSGEPHPSSNAYLALNRAFFFTKGLEIGKKLGRGQATPTSRRKKDGR